MIRRKCRRQVDWLLRRWRVAFVTDGGHNVFKCEVPEQGIAFLRIVALTSCELIHESNRINDSDLLSEHANCLMIDFME